MKTTSWVALIGLLGLGAIIIYTSLGIGFRCEVCIDFNGRTSCRSVDGAAQDHALAAARTNACAQLASGVTETMACERTPPLKSGCTAR
jgi:hypothetical protein